MVMSHGALELGFVFGSRDIEHPVAVTEKARSELHQKLRWKGDHLEVLVASAIHSHVDAAILTMLANFVVFSPVCLETEVHEPAA